MKNCAIVCEYNPFHTGHKFQLDRVREHSVDNIFCVMSGQFVQSAMPAFCDKAIRAECAVLGGADAVIELPAVFATASAQIFAEGAVKIISDIKNIGVMAMGAVAEPSDILRLAEIKIKYKERFKTALKTAMKSGKSYNAASVAALGSIYGELYSHKPSVDGILADPNNILCLEYIAAIDKYAAYIEPIIIKRRGAGHNDENTDKEFISATAIRNAELSENIESVRGFIPYKYAEITAWRAAHAPNIALYKSIAVYAIKRAATEKLALLRDCSEGMEYLLKSISDKSDYDDYIDTISGKRYGKKRVYRIFLDALLDIDKIAVDNRFCTRLLACKRGLDFSLLPNYVKTTNAAIKAAADADSQVRKTLEIDEAAVALYNTICRIDGDYYNYSLVKI